MTIEQVLYYLAFQSQPLIYLIHFNCIRFMIKFIVMNYLSF